MLRISLRQGWTWSPSRGRKRWFAVWRFEEKMNYYLSICVFCIPTFYPQRQMRERKKSPCWPKAFRAVQLLHFSHRRWTEHLRPSRLPWQWAPPSHDLTKSLAKHCAPPSSFVQILVKLQHLMLHAHNSLLAGGSAPAHIEPRAPVCERTH